MMRSSRSDSRGQQTLEVSKECPNNDHFRSEAQIAGCGGNLYLDEVLPLLLACADGLLDAPQLVEDGLSLVQLVIRLTAGHLPVDPVTQTHTLRCHHRVVSSFSQCFTMFTCLI